MSKAGWGVRVAMAALVSVISASRAEAFEFHGFGDVGYLQSVGEAGATRAENGGFSLGELDLYVAESLGPRFDVLSEVVVKPAASGSGFVITVERLQIGYLHSDYLKVYAGRFHTPLGYWNTAYHHGAFLQTPILDPIMWRGFLPVHTVGLVASGNLFGDRGLLTYSALFGNGSSLASGVQDPNNASDNDKNKAAGFRVALTQSGMTPWTAGLSAYSSRVQGTPKPPLTAPIDVMQLVAGVDLTKTEGRYEFLAEYFLLRNQDELTGGDSTMDHAWYVQFGFEAWEGIRPYFRSEKISVDEADPYALALGIPDNVTETAGVRFRLGDQSVLKLEGRSIAIDGTQHHHEYAAQWAFTF